MGLIRDLTYPRVLIPQLHCVVPILKDGKTEVSPHQRAPLLSPSCLDRMTLMLTQDNKVEKIVPCSKHVNFPWGNSHLWGYLIDKSNWNRSKCPRNLRGVKLPCKGGCWRAGKKEAEQGRQARRGQEAV